MKLQGKRLGKLPSKRLRFHKAKVKPSQETTISRIRTSTKVAGVEVEVTDCEIRELEYGLHCIHPG